jgi:hypothetical protein
MCADQITTRRSARLGRGYLVAVVLVILSLLAISGAIAASL